MLAGVSIHISAILKNLIFDPFQPFLRNQDIVLASKKVYVSATEMSSWSSTGGFPSKPLSCKTA